eukprot:TRINITY_DN3794_c0_g1_i1.p1 TRINITY_DN3794_c0_g1~~TRINITY_DN3794_c0_g1_i1.p1  ORF type:complete len:365 (-),score=55.30 TRINITY_DN3794_c0_g1_i1:647-1741(-)
MLSLRCLALRCSAVPRIVPLAFSGRHASYRAATTPAGTSTLPRLPFQAFRRYTSGSRVCNSSTRGKRSYSSEVASTKPDAKIPPNNRKKLDSGEHRVGWTKRNKGLVVILGVLVGGGVGIIGYEAATSDGKTNPITSLQNKASQWMHSIFSSMTDYSPQDPLLPPVVDPMYARPYTLVIDCKELIKPEYDDKVGWRRKKRPGCEFFFVSLAQNYEVVLWNSTESIWTGLEGTSDRLDPHRVGHRLFMEHVSVKDGKEVKDLNNLNRDMSKVIVVSSEPESYGEHVENVLKIKEWEGNEDDASLLDLVFFLEELAVAQPTDLRPVLQRFEGMDVVEMWNPRRLDMQRQMLADQQQAKGAGQWFAR